MLNGEKFSSSDGQLKWKIIFFKVLFVSPASRLIWDESEALQRHRTILILKNSLGFLHFLNNLSKNVFVAIDVA